MTTNKYIFHKTQLKQGANWEYSFTCKDNNRNVLPLTGYTAVVQFRTSHGGTLILEASTTNTKVVIDEAAGEVAISLGYADTLLFPGGTIYADIFLINAAGDTRNSPINIEIEVIPRVTEIP